jgi:hypothetical protein
LEQAIAKFVYALASYNTSICEALLTNLRDRFLLEEVAGVVLVSLERLLWMDANAFVWAIQHFLPADVTQEIRRITSVTLGKRLIAHGFQPGYDFSVDASGRLLLNDLAKATVLKSC